MADRQQIPILRSRKIEMDMSEDAFGFLKASDEYVNDGDALRQRLEQDGYVYLPGVLNRDAVLESRRELVRRLAASGVLDPSADPMDAVVAPLVGGRYLMPRLAADNAPLMELLYGRDMMAIFERIFKEPVLHFDYTWLRAITPGGSTAPHCDAVYMGRGTLDLLTAWTPLGDIPLTIGGLILLENSHRRGDVLSSYISQDVDAFCENGPNAEKIREGKLNWEHWDGSFEPWDGSISHDVVELRQQLGGRWLTADFKAGDVVIFTMRTVHASLDNSSNQIRLSSDTRYQPASLPVDERWIGSSPIAHGVAGKRGRIC